MVDLMYTEYNWNLNIKEEKIETDDLLDIPQTDVRPGSSSKKDHKRSKSPGKIK